MEKVRIKSLGDDENVVNTAGLLDRVYNGHTKLKSKEAHNIRRALLKEILDFQKWLNAYYDDESEDDEKQFAMNKIGKHLKPKSAFCAFKRWIIRGNRNFMNEFSNCLIDHKREK